MKPHEIYRDIVERAPDGVYVASPNGIEYVNGAFEKITGIAAQSLRALGRGFIELVHPEDRRVLLEARKTRIAGKKTPSVLRIRLARKNERVKHLELRTSLIPGKGGLIFGIVRDVTRCRRAEESRQAREDRTLAAFDSAKEGILILQGARIRYVNPAIEEISGYGREDLLSKRVHDFIDPGASDLIRGRRRGKKPGGAIPFSFDLDLKTKREDLFHAGLEVTEIAYRGKNAFLVVVHDMQKESVMEAKLIKAVESLRTVLDATVQALTQLVERRDPYTAGHQRRVADLGRAIAAGIGLSEDQIESVGMSGLLHDIGKIAIPAEILTKPTPLTEAEFSLIKTHPGAALEILRTITFPWPVADIIHQHHERMDGSGYPRGLAGDEILLEARILAVADVVEAMITHRPYREARKLEDALEEIAKHRGTLYDARAVDACTDAFRSKGFSFTAEG